MSQTTRPGVSAEEPSGETALRMIRDGRRPQIPLGGMLEFDLTTVEPGRVGFDLRTDERMVNSGGIVHGGVLSLVLDQAIGDAVRTLLPDEVRYVTLDLYLTYLRPIKAGTTVRCEAWVTHLGRRTARTAGKVVDGSKIACECMSTLFVDR